MLKLKETDRFSQDLRRYQRDIESMSESDAKTRAVKLLSELITHCNLIDEAHNSRNNGYIDPRNVRDNIEKSVMIRRELNLLIKDFKEC